MTARSGVRRIGDRATFQALRQTPRRARQGPFSVAFVPGEPGGTVRVAYAIGRRLGGAVVRNRLRRRLRAVVSGLDGRLEPGAYLVVARPEAVQLPFEELRTTVISAMTRSATRESR